MLLDAPMDTTWQEIHSTSDTTWLDATPDGWRYQYEITALDSVGNESPPSSPDHVTGTSGTPSTMDFALHQCVPNPFNPTTEIRFELSRGGAVRLEVYNVSGQRVCTLASGVWAAGAHSVTWEGRDTNGTPASSGVYFYRFESGDYSESKRMTLLR